MESKYNMILDNPFYDNPNRIQDMKILDSYKDGSAEQRKYLMSRDSESIVEDDLEKIRKSDGIVAFANETTMGTPMEIFFASRILRMPVYIITKKYPYHPWVKKHATKIFPNRTAFEEYTKKKFGLRHGLC